MTPTMKLLFILFVYLLGVFMIASFMGMNNQVEEEQKPVEYDENEFHTEGFIDV